MKTNDRYSHAFSVVAENESNVFSDLVKVSGLDPTIDFQEARLGPIDLEGSDLSKFNFDRADLRGAKWEGVLAEPQSANYSLRGSGKDNVSGADFSQVSEICTSQENWGERFLAFKILIDNWGENIETSNVLMRILKEDGGIYLRLCTFVYFCASYNKDAKMKSLCVEMAKAGRSQVNIYRTKKLRKAVRDYSKYFEGVVFKRRYPGDIDNETFLKIQDAISDIEGKGPDQRFL